MIKYFYLVLISFSVSFSFAKEPPANFPLVNGLVKKIDINNKMITLKHEAIPNLKMPGMTMPFQIQDIQMLENIKVGDKVNFAADSNEDGDIVIIWIEKIKDNPITVLNHVVCNSEADTSPKTNVEIEVTNGKLGTIQYTYADGSFAGTTFINSIGKMFFKQEDSNFEIKSGDEVLDTKLVFQTNGLNILNAKFYHYYSGMNFKDVQCAFRN